MCEIYPKRKQFFQLEFFTSMEMSENQWNELVITRLLMMEQAFNMEGKVRVHIHEIDEVQTNMGPFDPDGGEL